MGWNLLPQRLLSESSPSIPPKTLDVEPSSISVETSKPLTRVQELKADLKCLLASNGGSTTDPDVMSVINALVELNPCVENCARTQEFQGDFSALSTPHFPGRLKSEPGKENVVQYTLGRMSFNIFQPAKLVCTARGVRNPVTKQLSTEGGQCTYSYPVVVDITIHTPDGDLPAVLINEAYCYENTEVANRLMVSFTGGTLLPAEDVHNDPAKLDLWSRTFQGAYKKAGEERSYFGWVFQFFIKFLLGLTYPTDASLARHSFHFDMKRAPLGYLDVLYLDEDLRITRGNRGTIVVVERSTKVFAQ